MHHDFLDKYSDRDSLVHHLDARVKIFFFFFLIIVCVSTPAQRFPAFFLYLGILAAVWSLSKVPLTHILRKSLVVIPFTVIVSAFIPFIDTGERSGGVSLGIGAEVSPARLLLFWNIVIKSYTAVVALILLLSTTGFPALLSGFRSLKVPALLIDMLSFLYRYIFVIIDEAHRMKRALDSRLYRGRWLGQVKIIGNLLGTLFLRSYERGERVYLAMSARGGAAGIGSTSKPLAVGDVAALMGGIAVLLVVRLAAV